MSNKDVKKALELIQNHHDEYLKNGMIFMQMLNLQDIDEQIEQVRQQSKLKFLVEPRAIKAYYCSHENTIAIHLNTGAVLTIPIANIQWIVGSSGFTGNNV